MRVSREKTQETRQRILETAGRMFREKGIHAVGVDAVMKEAGLTHGGFYGHFGSKDELAAEAVGQVMGDSLKAIADDMSLGDFVNGYLSRDHCNDAAGGCPVAALGPELARMADGKRGFATEFVRARIAQMQELLEKDGRPDSRDAAIAELSTLIGALVMARVVDDEALTHEILDGTRGFLAQKH